ncbi:MAG: hypothetical protein ACON42_04605 [Flavobacteriaceae bacterium]
MDLPKFLIADASEQPEAIYVVHTVYPRFILNVANDEVVWLEEFQQDDEKELAESAETLLQEAFDFYDQEMESLD